MQFHLPSIIMEWKFCVPHKARRKARALYRQSILWDRPVQRRNCVIRTSSRTCEVECTGCLNVGCVGSKQSFLWQLVLFCLPVRWFLSSSLPVNRLSSSALKKYHLCQIDNMSTWTLVLVSFPDSQQTPSMCTVPRVWERDYTLNYLTMCKLVSLPSNLGLG